MRIKFCPSANLSFLPLSLSVNLVQKEFRVVNKPIYKQLVKGLLHFDKDGAASFCCPVDIEDCGFVVQYAGILFKS